MEYFDASKMPTPLLATIITISNIFFTAIGCLIMYLWTRMDGNSVILPVYGLLIVLSAYITLLIISYVCVRAVFNRYVHYIHLRLFIQQRTYEEI